MSFTMNIAVTLHKETSCMFALLWMHMHDVFTSDNWCSHVQLMPVFVIIILAVQCALVIAAPPSVWHLVLSLQ